MANIKGGGGEQGVDIMREKACRIWLHIHMVCLMIAFWVDYLRLPKREVRIWLFQEYASAQTDYLKC